ncbi:hypothetical protein [Alkalimarinus alittae]|uniref:Uncharacterized protein n=1 Tax=Alkalimarinus alittae TaxID=2961619 RepID=A0ABY6N5X5_9ALTE|nr:hypothetical protein [Alkalimarinus alittae]UZE97528.1 hypothetical protein NKI27_07240 [Alkalimarinus alittae]
MTLDQIIEKFGDTWLKFEEFGMERTAIYGGDTTDQSHRVYVAMSLNSDDLTEQGTLLELSEAGGIVSVEVLALSLVTAWPEEEEDELF